MSQLREPISDRDHIRGNRRAPLRVVEYGDYQCPFCGAAEPKVTRLEASLDDNLELVFRHFPLTQAHEWAFEAAMCAEAAAAQDHFWEMHEALFRNQDALGPDLFESLAQELGLDLDQFRQDMASPATRRRIQHDFLTGVRSGVNGTPSFFLNGEKYEGSLDPDVLRELLRAA